MRKSKYVKSRASSAKLCGRNSTEMLKTGLSQEMNIVSALGAPLSHGGHEQRKLQTGDPTSAPGERCVRSRRRE